MPVTIARMFSSARSRISGRKVRTVPLIVSSLCTTLLALKLPQLIEQMETTADSIGSTLRETIVWSAVTIWAATGIGSTPRCGRPPCVPLPRSVM